jgi:hypothetical protein
MEFSLVYVGSSEAGTDRFRRLQNRISFGHLGDRSVAADVWLNGYFACACCTQMQLHTD